MYPFACIYSYRLVSGISFFNYAFFRRVLFIYFDRSYRFLFHFFFLFFILVIFLGCKLVIKFLFVFLSLLFCIHFFVFEDSQKSWIIFYLRVT